MYYNSLLLSKHLHKVLNPDFYYTADKTKWIGDTEQETDIRTGHMMVNGEVRKEKKHLESL